MNEIQAVIALLARDLRAFLRSRSQLYSSVLFPLMLLAILGTGVSAGLDPKNIHDYVTFLTPGLVVMTALFSSTFSSASYYQDRDSGLLRVMLASPHRAPVILLGKALAGVTIGSAQAMALLVIATLIPGIDLDWQYGVVAGLLLAGLAILLLALLLNGFAQMMSTRIGTMQGFHLVMNLLLFPLLFFSGAFFPLADLPVWLRILAAINPLSYGVDLLHIAVYANDGGHFGLLIDLLLLLALAPATFVLGLGGHRDIA